MNCSLDYYHADVREGRSYIGFHRHAGFELVYYVDGRGTTRIQDTEYEYGPGTFAIIRPGCRHDEYRETSTHVRYLVFFYDNMPIPLRNGLHADCQDGWMAGLLGRMADEQNGKSKYYDMQLRCLLMEMIVGIGRMDRTEQPHRANGMAEEAKRYLDHHGFDEVDLQGLASALGYGYDYFRHLFKEETGFSPKQYVIRNRITSAKHMLLQTDKPITEIALECGFSNAPQFCMMFKKLIGVTPSRFRQAYPR